MGVNHGIFFSGIGIATNCIMFFVNCYYNVILAWAFFYMFASFTTELPWNSCGNWWNTDRCTDFKLNSTAANVTATAAKVVNDTGIRIDSVTEYWE